MKLNDHRFLFIGIQPGAANSVHKAPVGQV